MNLSEDQRDALIKHYGDNLAEAILQTLEEKQAVVSLYGDYEEINLSELSSQIQSINKLIEDEINPALENLATDILRVMEQSKEFGDRINSLEGVIEPDKTDVYNIDRRIELLAQRVAEIESGIKKKNRMKKGMWRFDKE